MSIKIKKTTFKLALLGLATLGFILAFFLKLFLGDSINLSKLESKSKQIFPTDNLKFLTPIARADISDAGDSSSDGCGGDSGGDGGDGGDGSGGSSDGSCDSCM
jgi:uncharacterized membrane protein YgcG